MRHITIEGGRATGIALTHGTDAEIVTASQEVILSAGAIGSPFLLLHSGIGPADQLQRLGITVAADLPGVGGNLQDHPTAPLQYATTDKWPIADDSNIAEAGAFMRSRQAESDAAPELQCHFLIGVWSADERRFVPGEVGIAVHVLRPLSRGSLALVSADPQEPPAIDLGLLREPVDAEMLADGVELLRDITAAEPLASALSGETLPGRDVSTRRDLARAIRETAGHVWHPVGTCRMGTDDSAVVDARLRVRGIDGLRVADASIMPAIVSGNTNAPTIMIAEKAADLILATIG